MFEATMTCTEAYRSKYGEGATFESNGKLCSPEIRATYLKDAPPFEYGKRYHITIEAVSE